jgi:hypothetical protein
MRLIAVAVALALGWITYMIGMVLTVYDGLMSILFQPLMAAFTSGLFVSAALVLGLVLRIPVLARWWTATWLWAALIGGASLLVLAFGYSLGLTDTGTNPETGESVVTLHPAAALGGYFFLLFAAANWPTRRRGNANPPQGGAFERPGSAA